MSQLAALEQLRRGFHGPPTAPASTPTPRVLRDEQKAGNEVLAAALAHAQEIDLHGQLLALAGLPREVSRREGSGGPQARSRGAAGRQPGADRRRPPRRGLRPGGQGGQARAQVKAQHDMRIAVKRLRYVLELGDGCFGPYTRTALRRTKELQDVLGEIHDCDVALPRVLTRLESSARATRSPCWRGPTARRTSTRRSRRGRRTHRRGAGWSRSAPTCVLGARCCSSASWRCGSGPSTRASARS